MNSFVHSTVAVSSLFICALVLWEDFSPYGHHRLWIIPLVFIVFLLVVALVGPFTVTMLQLFQNFKN